MAAPATPPVDAISPEDREVLRKAQRFARLLVDEIKLYNQAKVAEGRKNKDLYDRLKDAIEKSRATYQKRYGNTFAASANYFQHDHKNQPTSILAYYMVNKELFVSEEIWTREIAIGPLVLTDVPVTEDNQSAVDLFSSADTQFQATLGFAALKRLDIIIDGKHSIAYLRPRQTPSLPYEHNRLGATFVERDPTNNDLVAHVVDGTPAFDGGIRNDDVLLKIDELDATKWRTDPNVTPLSRFWYSPAGTKLELTLKRGDRVFKTTAVLRNILPPDAPKDSN